MDYESMTLISLVKTALYNFLEALT